jgi:hypothetical protein
MPTGGRAIQAQPGVLNIPPSCVNSGPPEISAFNYPPDNIVFPNIVCPAGESQDGNTSKSGHLYIWQQISA